MAPSKRADDAKPWLCKTCLDKDGEPFRNHDFRTSCFRCHLAKGKVCLRNVAPPQQRTSPTFSERQVAGQRSAEKQEKLRAAERKRADDKIRSLQDELRKAKAGEIQEVEDEEERDEETVENLVEQRKLLKTQGRSDSHKDVAGLTARIAERRVAKEAELPGHAQIRLAEQRVAKGKAAIKANEARGEKLAADLARAHAAVQLHDAGAAKALVELQEAEVARSLLFKGLQEAPKETPVQVDTPAVLPLATFAVQWQAMLAAMPSEAFGGPNAGTLDQCQAVCKQVLGYHEKEEAKRAEAAAELLAADKAKLATDLVVAPAAADAPLAATSVERFSRADIDALMDEVRADLRAGLDEAGVDATVKRSTDTIFELVKRRKLRTIDA